MNNTYNSFAFDLSEKASIPRSFSFQTGVDSAEKLKTFLYKVINNERANRKLYLRLIDKGLNKPVHIKDVKLELLPGKFINVYFVLKDNLQGPKGSSGAIDRFFNKESKITITLYADIEEDVILWSDSYYTTIDHELTHMFQSMDVAIRYLFLKHAGETNYSPDYDDIMKMLTQVNIKNKKYNQRLNKDILSDPNKYLKYMSSDREMGARAHALLRELYAKDQQLFREVIEFCETGWPNFDYINKELSKKPWHGWKELTDFGNREMQVNHIAEHETFAYVIKQKLLQKLYDFYRTQYKGR